MSGGKGGSTTSSVQIPDWAQDAAKKNIAMGEYASQLGYMPYYGLDVAAQTPAQQAANQNFGSAVSAFGGQAPVDMNAGMPTAQTIDGVSGYSSGGLFDSALAELQQRRPAQYQAYSDMFINPVTGEQGTVFTPVGSFSNDPTNTAATYNPDSTYDGSGASAVNFNQSLQDLADAPSWLYGLPVVGGAKMLATNYVNKQAADTASNFANTNRGFSNDGNTYTSSWGGTYNASNFSPETRAGLAAVANDPFSAASGQAHSYGDFAD